MFRKGISFFVFIALMSNFFMYGMRFSFPGSLTRTLSQEDKDRQKDRAAIKDLVRKYKTEPCSVLQLALVDGDLNKVKELLNRHKVVPSGKIPASVLASSHHWLSGSNPADSAILDELVKAEVDIHQPDRYGNTLLDRVTLTVLAEDCGAQFEKDKERRRLDVSTMYHKSPHIMTFLAQYSAYCHVRKDLPTMVRKDLKHQGIQLRLKFDVGAHRGLNDLTAVSNNTYALYQRIKKLGGTLSSPKTEPGHDCGAVNVESNSPSGFEFSFPLPQFERDESDEAENK